MSAWLEKRIQRQLKAARLDGLYRNPPILDKSLGRIVCQGNRELLNFASNDYLGLGSSEKTAQMVGCNFKKYHSSASSSRLVSGNFQTTLDAEKAYAQYFGYDEAVFFPSGYQANLAVLSTFLKKEDIVIFDKHIHASSVAGLTMSGSALKGYNHNAMDHLAKRLSSLDDTTAAVVTESLFSMDGDLLDLENYQKLKDEYSFLSIIDEAHAFGALGPGGRGISGKAADIALGTFGKAFGLFGAFVLMPEGCREYLMNFASPLIYTTALPEAHAVSALELLDLVFQSDDKRRYLGQISQLMKDTLIHEGFTADGQAHIISILIGDEDRACALCKTLFNLGILAFPARYPTVQKGKAILRVSMSAFHRPEDVTVFVEKLKQAQKTCQTNQQRAE